MEQKAKYIILGLIGILAISFAVNLQIISTKKALEKAKEGLEKENSSLNEKITSLDTSLQEKKRLEEKLRQDLEEVSRAKEELETKYDTVDKEKTKLSEELNSLKAGLGQPGEAPVSLEATDRYWAGILRSKLDLELQLQNTRNELKNTQLTNEELRRQGVTLDLDFKNLQRDRDDLKRDAEYTRKLVDSLSADLVREKSDKMQIMNSLKYIKTENSILRQQLRSLSYRKVNLERKLQSLQEAKNQLEDKINQMETTLGDQALNINTLRQQLDSVPRASRAGRPEAEKAIELPPIVVQPQTPAFLPQQSPAATTGRILAVNKENNFVVIDLGENAGLKLGDRLDVYRQDKVIAIIKVIRTRKSIAACDIERELLPIRVDDIVK